MNTHLICPQAVGASNPTLNAVVPLAAEPSAACRRSKGTALLPHRDSGCRLLACDGEGTTACGPCSCWKWPAAHWGPAWTLLEPTLRTGPVALTLAGRAPESPTPHLLLDEAA